MNPQASPSCDAASLPRVEYQGNSWLQAPDSLTSGIPSIWATTFRAQCLPWSQSLLFTIVIVTQNIPDIYSYSSYITTFAAEGLPQAIE